MIVMAGLVPAIHVFFRADRKSWMPGTRPGMTISCEPFAQLFSPDITGPNSSQLSPLKRII
jgi:hypothetical protein